MTAGWYEVRGRAYLSLERVADCYQVELTWIEEIRARGLLGEVLVVEGSPALAAEDLDRLAAILRWHRHHGLDLELVAALLAD